MDQTTDIKTNFNECGTLDLPTNLTSKGPKKLIFKRERTKDHLKLRLNRGAKNKKYKKNEKEKWRNRGANLREENERRVDGSGEVEVNGEIREDNKWHTTKGENRTLPKCILY